jgi:nicotinate-nucleotide adenylyltransferase
VKIGLLCGTFNPIHNGHLVIAEYFSEFTDLNEVWIVVSPLNPLKKEKKLLDDTFRLKMAKLALDKNKKIKANDVEFKLPRPSYTINTLTYLRANFPRNEFVLIIGEDNLQTFDKWKDYKKILEQFSVYTYPRPDTRETKFHGHKKIKLFKDVPLMNISATFIRKAISQNKNVQYMVPEKAWHFIQKKNLYKKNDQLTASYH